MFFLIERDKIPKDQQEGLSMKEETEKQLSGKSEP